MESSGLHTQVQARRFMANGRSVREHILEKCILIAIFSVAVHQDPERPEAPLPKGDMAWQVHKGKRMISFFLVFVHHS